jgi:hypothetical protein
MSNLPASRALQFRNRPRQGTPSLLRFMTIQSSVDPAIQIILFTSFVWTIFRKLDSPMHELHDSRWCGAAKANEATNHGRVGNAVQWPAVSRCPVHLPWSYYFQISYCTLTISAASGFCLNPTQPHSENIFVASTAGKLTGSSTFFLITVPILSATFEVMPGQNLRLLCFDGGGVRGLSSLLLLEQILKFVNPENPPKPCNYFHMIGGTSTGGYESMLQSLRSSFSYISI